MEEKKGEVRGGLKRRQDVEGGRGVEWGRGKGEKGEGRKGGEYQSGCLRHPVLLISLLCVAVRILYGYWKLGYGAKVLVVICCGSVMHDSCCGVSERGFA